MVSARKAAVHRKPAPPRISVHVKVDDSLMTYLPLVKSAARRVFQGLPAHSGVELTDLLQTGLLGLVRAARSYDPSLGCSFTTYALHRIRGEILDGLRRSDHVSRTVRRWEREVASAAHHLTGVLQRKPTEEELRAHLQLSSSQWETRRVSLWMTGQVTAPAGAPAARSAPEETTPAEQRPDALAARQELVEMVHCAVRRLPERTQAILQLYYSDELSMKQIGTIFHVNESRVSQIHKRALGKIEQSLRAKGIASAEEW